MSWSSDTADKKGTNGLSEQDVHEIKTDYACGFGVGSIADSRGLTCMQVIYAINLNELEHVDFDISHFAI